MPDMTERERVAFEEWWARDPWDVNPDIRGVAEDAFTAALAVHAQELAECKALLERCIERMKTLESLSFMHGMSTMTRDLIAAIERLEGGK